MNFEQFKKQFAASKFTMQQREQLIDILLDGATSGVFEHYFEIESIKSGPSASKIDFSTGNEPWRQWANTEKYLDGMQDEEKLVSFYFFSIGGFRPNFYTKAMWIKCVKNVLNAAGGDPSVVEEGARVGQKSRVDNGLTFSSPLAYQSYVLDIMSKKTLEQSGFAFKEEIWA